MQQTCYISKSMLLCDVQVNFNVFFVAFGAILVMSSQISRLGQKALGTVGFPLVVGYIAVVVAFIVMQAQGAICFANNVLHNLNLTDPLILVCMMP